MGQRVFRRGHPPKNESRRGAERTGRVREITWTSRDRVATGRRPETGPVYGYHGFRGVFVLYPNTDTHAYADPNANAYADSNPDADTKQQYNTDANTDANADPDTDSDADAKQQYNTDADADADIKQLISLSWYHRI